MYFEKRPQPRTTSLTLFGGWLGREDKPDAAISLIPTQELYTSKQISKRLYDTNVNKYTNTFIHNQRIYIHTIRSYIYPIHLYISGSLQCIKYIHISPIHSYSHINISDVTVHYGKSLTEVS